MPAKRRVPKKHLKSTWMENPNSTSRKILNKLRRQGYSTTIKSVDNTRRILDKETHLFPAAKQRSIIDPATGVPKRTRDKIARVFTQNQDAIPREVAKRFEVGPSYVMKIRAQALGKRTKRLPSKRSGGSFSKIDRKTGVPKLKTHRIRRMIIKNPEMRNTEIATAIGKTAPVEVAWERINLRKRGYKIPKLNPGPKPKK